jgi:hypothetical protein
VAAERSADEIQRDIEVSRAALAHAVDELAYRTNPKRVVEKTKASLKARAQSTEGMIAIGAVAVVVAFVVVRKVRKR